MQNISAAKNALQKAETFCNKLRAAGYDRSNRIKYLRLKEYSTEDILSYSSGEALRRSHEMLESSNGYLERFQKAVRRIEEEFPKIKELVKEALPLVSQARNLCIEMDDAYRVAKNDQFKCLLDSWFFGGADDLNNVRNLETAKKVLQEIRAHVKEYEEAFEQFKNMAPVERSHKRTVEQVMRELKTIPVPAFSRREDEVLRVFFAEEQERLSILLDTKKYPIAIPGFAKKRAEITLLRMRDEYLPFMVKTGLGVDCILIEANGERILLAEKEELTEEALTRIKRLVFGTLARIQKYLD